MIGPEIDNWLKALQAEREFCNRAIRVLEEYRQAHGLSRPLLPQAQEKIPRTPKKARTNNSRTRLTTDAKSIIVAKMAEAADTTARKKLAKKLAKQFGGAASTIRTHWSLWQKTIPNDVVHAE